MFGESKDSDTEDEDFMEKMGKEIHMGTKKSQNQNTKKDSDMIDSEKL